MQALARDFDGFLEFDELVHHEFATPNGDVFVAEDRSFWHDDVRGREAQEKYARRIARFRDLLQTAGQRNVPIIFARSVASTLELFEADLLRRLLEGIAGPARIFLLMLLDAQHKKSAIVFDSAPNLLVCTVSRRVDAELAYSVKRPPYVVAYHDALRVALAFASRGEVPQDAVRLPSPAPLLQAKNGFIRHVSMQEDLREPWSHDPHQPPQAVLQGLLEGQDTSKQSIMAEMMQAHVEALLGMS